MALYGGAALVREQIMNATITQYFGGPDVNPDVYSGEPGGWWRRSGDVFYMAGPSTPGAKWERHFHRGIDIAFADAPGARTDFRSPTDGTVLGAGLNAYGTHGYGNDVIVQSPSGLLVLMGHFRDGGVYVKNGDKVSVGEKIGVVGSTGQSTGPHMHLEIRTSDNTGVVDLAPHNKQGEIIASLYNLFSWSGTPRPMPYSCPAGSHYDTALAACVDDNNGQPISGGGGGNNPCPAGSHWDDALAACVQGPPVPGSGGGGGGGGGIGGIGGIIGGGGGGIGGTGLGSVIMDILTGGNPSSTGQIAETVLPPFVLGITGLVLVLHGFKRLGGEAPVAPVVGFGKDIVTKTEAAGKKVGEAVTVVAAPEAAPAVVAGAEADKKKGEEPAAAKEPAAAAEGAKGEKSGEPAAAKEPAAAAGGGEGAGKSEGAKK